MDTYDLNAFTMQHFSLKGKNAVITGANNGVGMGYAYALMKAGANVLIPCLNGNNWDTLRTVAADCGVQVEFLKGDLCDDVFRAQVVSAAQERFGSIDILINNAGFIIRKPLLECSDRDWTSVMNVNCDALYFLSRRVAEVMVRQQHGKIINICSMMSELGRETVSAYAAAKGGLKMLTKNICSEYGQYNIQCNGIGPGYIETPQTAPLREIQPDGSRHPFDQFICAKTPANRWLKPEELAGPAVFLASDASDAVNGHILYVDGGILAYIGKQPG